MGYIYNERTGEFKATSQVVWSILSWPFRLILAPFRLFIPLLRFLAWPFVLLWRLTRYIVGLLVMPFVLLKRNAPRLVGEAVVAVVAVWRLAGRIARWAFFPVVKWWEVEKEAFRDGDWFMAVLWCGPGLLLYVIYGPIVLLLLGVLRDIVVWVLAFPSSLIEWLKGVIS